MLFRGRQVVHSCLVVDATNDGARVKLNGLSVMPSDFGISFDRFRTMRQCRLVWRWRLHRHHVRKLKPHVGFNLDQGCLGLLCGAHTDARPGSSTLKV